MPTEEKITENPATVAPSKPKRRFKLDKKHIQGFIAGILVAAIAFTGLYYGTEGRFFKGSIGLGSINSAADFESQVIKSRRPVVVTFFVLEFIKQEGEVELSSYLYARRVSSFRTSYGRMDFYSVNAVELPLVARGYSIKRIPTCVIFNNGEIIARKEGNLTDREVELWLASSLKSITLP